MASTLLNKEQKLAVETTDGKVLVLAGAGSGKTSVLIQRIAFLVQDRKVLPSKILGLTFTNKAALEMRHRLARFIPPAVAKQVQLSTFHSFCYQLLRKEIHRLGYTKNFTLVDESEAKRIVEHIVREKLEFEGRLPSISSTFEALKSVRIQSNEPPKTTEKWHEKFLNDLPGLFQRSMKACNTVDFDGLIELSIALFKENPSLLAEYQERFSYIMIDEYQDTSPLQDELAKLLSLGKNNLCVVGDDDQSIYGFRGAKVDQILQFPYDQIIKLQQNYRSTPLILEAANAVIQNNKARHNKALWSEKDLGEEIHVFVSDDENTEAEGVIYRILELKEAKGLNWGDFAILYRSNILSRPIELALMRALHKDKYGKSVTGIPYHIVQGTEFYERREVKDLLAYMRTLTNPKDETAILRIINTPRRGISHESLEKITKFQRTNHLSLMHVLEKIGEQSDFVPELTQKAIDGIKQFVDLIKTHAKNLEKQKSPFQVMEELVEKIEYKKMITNEVKTEKAESFKVENVVETLKMIERYEESFEPSFDHPSPTLSDFLANSHLNQDPMMRGEDKDSENKVQLLTFHSAKGLEFPACFLIGLEDHILPHEKSLQEGSLEEERRLFYVAITRAMRYLTLSMAKIRKKMGQTITTTPSRFLHEIDPKNLKPSIWKHPLPYEK
ncbi:MAG: ATP-dependent helicase [Chlamydiia bacterium]